MMEEATLEKDVLLFSLWSTWSQWEKLQAKMLACSATAVEQWARWSYMGIQGRGISPQKVQHGFLTSDSPLIIFILYSVYIYHTYVICMRWLFSRTQLYYLTLVQCPCYQLVWAVMGSIGHWDLKLNCGVHNVHFGYTELYREKRQISLNNFFQNNLQIHFYFSLFDSGSACGVDWVGKLYILPESLYTILYIILCFPRWHVVWFGMAML